MQAGVGREFWGWMWFDLLALGVAEGFSGLTEAASQRPLRGVAGQQVSGVCRWGWEKAKATTGWRWFVPPFQKHVQFHDILYTLFRDILYTSLLLEMGVLGV